VHQRFLHERKRLFRKRFFSIHKLAQLVTVTVTPTNVLEMPIVSAPVALGPRSSTLNSAEIAGTDFKITLVNKEELPAPSVSETPLSIRKCATTQVVRRRLTTVLYVPLPLLFA